MGRNRLKLCSLALFVWLLLAVVYHKWMTFCDSGCAYKDDSRMTELSSKHDGILFKSSLSGSGSSQFEKRFPKVLLVGFGKTGTHAVRLFLGLHPDVVAARSEIYFFDKFYSKGLEWYRNKMPRSLPHQLTLEKTPTYCCNQTTLERIKTFDPDIKLLVLVRDPVVHLQSHYAHDKAMTQESSSMPSFSSWLEQKDGMKMYGYLEHVRRMSQMFRPEQLLVLDGDELIQDPVTILHEIEIFLHIQPFFTPELFYFNQTKGFFCMDTSRMNLTSYPSVDSGSGCLSKSKGREHTVIERPLLRQIVAQYELESEEMFRIIGKSFNWTTLDNLDLRF